MSRTDAGLLECKTQLIVVPMDCVSKSPKEVTDKYPHAVFIPKPIPGTIDVRGESGKLQWVCALYIQYFSGRPTGKRNDTIESRRGWLKEALYRVTKIKNLRSLAIPGNLTGNSSIDLEALEEFVCLASLRKVKVTITGVNLAPTLNHIIKANIPVGWEALFELQSESISDISDFLEGEVNAGKIIYPPQDLVFYAFYLTAPKDIRVLILGQDPYISKGQAMGMSFSVPEGIYPPPSLKNIFIELEDDGFTVDDNLVPKFRRNFENKGDLTRWSAQGVFLLNTALTVEEGKSDSHSTKWLDSFTPTLMQWLDTECNPMVIIMWGAKAQRYSNFFGSRHKKIMSPHPSPFSARTGFFGSKPFSKANEYLEELGYQPIDWSLCSN